MKTAFCVFLLLIVGTIGTIFHSLRDESFGFCIFDSQGGKAKFDGEFQRNNSPKRAGFDDIPDQLLNAIVDKLLEAICREGSEFAMEYKIRENATNCSDQPA